MKPPFAAALLGLGLALLLAPAAQLASGEGAAAAQPPSTRLSLPVDPTLPPTLIVHAVVPRDQWDVPRATAWDHPPTEGLENSPLTQPSVIGATPSNPRAADLPMLSLGDAVLGTLKGNGSFAYYRFNFERWLDFNNGPNAEQLWIWFDPASTVTFNGVGFNVFDDSGTVVAKSQAMDHDAVMQGGQLVPRGAMKNAYYWNPRAAQPLVQVYNYSPTPIRFALGTALRWDDIFRLRLM